MSFESNRGGIEDVARIEGKFLAHALHLTVKI
jgi:hypothetical protein